MASFLKRGREVIGLVIYVGGPNDPSLMELGISTRRKDGDTDSIKKLGKLEVGRQITCEADLDTRAPIETTVYGMRILR